MKRVMMILGFVILGIATYGQTINDIPIEELNTKYITVTATAKIARQTEVHIEVDFGQENKYFKVKDTYIKDSEGKILEFESAVDALNFWDENGYELVEAYSYEINVYVKHSYIMRRTR